MARQIIRSQIAMLDSFSVFTRGGALLWTLQFAALRHNPVDALNALIKACLLEERSNDSTFVYAPKTGAHQALKWTFHNGLGLVFVAVYQKSLSLLYIDELLNLAKAEFSVLYQSGTADFRGFEEKFNKILRDCESRADQAKKGGLAKSKAVTKTTPLPGRSSGSASRGSLQAASAAKTSSDGAEGDAEDSGDAKGEDGLGHVDDIGEDALPQAADEGGAFDVSKLKGRPGARGRPTVATKKESKGEKGEDKQQRKKADRKWDTMGHKQSDSAAPTRLDFSEGPDPIEGGSATDAGTATESDSAAVRGKPGGWWGGSAAASDSDASAVRRGHQGVSHMDVEEDSEFEDVDEELLAASKKATGGSKASTGLLGSFLNRLALRVVGSDSLTTEDIDSALADMKKRLMERNVAEGIAESVCASVGRSLVGQKLASFTGVGTLVRRAFEEALSGILHKRQVDVLLDIRKSQERGKPYVVVFCGVNGVGKSTNLAKIAYWLGQHNIKVTIAACDTFRAGAVEQLKTHCARLGVPLYERGYEKDPAKVAAEAVKQAERDGRHVVLVDTAGRMQDNEPLMRALSNLIAVNDPQLVLFVGEALVGNDAVDQLTKFSRALQDLSPLEAGGGTSRRAGRGVDGIVLTKFDTIDDKVGAALSMVYSSGAPIMFVGCGQTYVDLKKLNVKSVVNSLLK